MRGSALAVRLLPQPIHRLAFALCRRERGWFSLNHLCFNFKHPSKRRTAVTEPRSFHDSSLSAFGGDVFSREEAA